MSPTTVGLLALSAIGGTAVLRQRSEARRVQAGRLATLGPDGQPPELRSALPQQELHRVVAAWRPARPATPAGRTATVLWAAPLTALGIASSLLGGALPTHDLVRSCLVARGVGGLPGRFIGGQGATAATLGQVVLSRSHAPSPRLLDHEAAHVRQQERLGLLFAILYPLGSARWGYRANPFEVAARAVAEAD